MKVLNVLELMEPTCMKWCTRRAAHHSATGTMSAASTVVAVTISRAGARPDTGLGHRVGTAPAQGLFIELQRTSWLLDNLVAGAPRPVHGLDRGGLPNLDCSLPPPRHRSEGPARKRSRRGGRQPRPWHAREKAEPWRRDYISKDWLSSSGSSLPWGGTHQLSVVFEPGFEPTSTSLWPLLTLKPCKIHRDTGNA
jgi:hypothetical protein